MISKKKTVGDALRDGYICKINKIPIDISGT